MPLSPAILSVTKGRNNDNPPFSVGISLSLVFLFSVDHGGMLCGANGAADWVDSIFHIGERNMDSGYIIDRGCDNPKERKTGSGVRGTGKAAFVFAC